MNTAAGHDAGLVIRAPDTGDPHPASRATTADRMLATTMGVGVAITVAYWADYFSRGDVRTSTERAYDDFEKAFLLADGYVAVTSLAAARALWKGQPSAVGAGIAAGSGATFLGLMDLAYDIEQGKFSDHSPAMAMETALIAGCLTLGPLTMRRMWRSRTRLAGLA